MLLKRGLIGQRLESGSHLWQAICSAWNCLRHVQSPPARGRGLKHIENNRIEQGPCVAPRAGAWIETASLQCSAGLLVVAPRAGAWIETASVR